MVKKEFITVPLKDIIPYEKNPRRNDEAAVDVAKSIQEIENLDPIEVDEDNVILSGHTRLKALKKLGYTETEVIRFTGLTEQKKKAYRILANKTQEKAEWDLDLLNLELDDITDIDMSGFGFSDLNTGTDWFEDHGDSTTQEDNDEYNEFTAKFEPKKTTDDCYTPQKVYDAIAGWVVDEYGVNKDDFVRPFFPGGDYQSFRYKDGCIVCDNPPFSILSEILKFYTEKRIQFFLFAPALTLFSSSSSSCAIGTGISIVYENGAVIDTSFLTNLEPGTRFRTAPELYRRGMDAVKEILREQRRELPKYSYPVEVVTSSMLSTLSQYGQDFKVSRSESYHTRQLDSQKDKGKTIFGSGYLISEKAAAEKAAAEKAAAEKWLLSEREKKIVKDLTQEGRC